MRIGMRFAAAVALLVLAGLVADVLSPWPSALIIRSAMNIGGVRLERQLAARVPAGITALPDQGYEPGDPEAQLDVYFPSAARKPALTTVVWIHGGGFLAGSRAQVASYAQIVAAGGYTVVAVDYALAPGKKYPVPLRQINQALGYVVQNAPRLHVDPGRLVLAGDSAGALLAGQLANLTTSASYARLLGIAPALAPAQLAGVILYCGPYDVHPAAQGGSPSWFMRTVLRSYLGAGYAQDARLPTLDLVRYLTPRFPPAFLSVGNADPLAPQSRALAAALERLNVRVDSVFFAPDYSPALGHEYQFNLELAAAGEALQRSLAFLATLH